MKELIFVCPECGSNELGSIENVLTTYPVFIIKEDGDLDYGPPSTHDSTVIAYECLDCGYQLTKDNGVLITDCLEVPKWVEKNSS